MAFEGPMVLRLGCDLIVRHGFECIGTRVGVGALCEYDFSMAISFVGIALYLTIS
jgi:hypothetical protein